MTRVYKIELMVVDLADDGPQAVTLLIESTLSSNFCIEPRVNSVEERQLEWDKDHPLNSSSGWQRAFADLFSEGKKP
jgi:hypothetical protein